VVGLLVGIEVHVSGDLYWALLKGENGLRVGILSLRGEIYIVWPGSVLCRGRSS